MEAMTALKRNDRLEMKTTALVFSKDGRATNGLSKQWILKSNDPAYPGQTLHDADAPSAHPSQRDPPIVPA